MKPPYGSFWLPLLSLLMQLCMQLRPVFGVVIAPVSFSLFINQGVDKEFLVFASLCSLRRPNLFLGLFFGHNYY
jgi:hypothetical protein